MFLDNNCCPVKNRALRYLTPLCKFTLKQHARNLTVSARLCSGKKVGRTREDTIWAKILHNVMYKSFIHYNRSRQRNAAGQLQRKI